MRESQNSTQKLDQGLSRFDVVPTLRFPFTRWPFLTFNSSVSWRDTYWTESLAPGTNAQVATPISRRYYDLSTRITGPTFTRIFNKPGRKLKHVIQPTLALQRTSPIDNFDRIVKLDGNDWIVGRVTRATYCVTNRLYAKKDTAR